MKGRIIVTLAVICLVSCDRHSSNKQESIEQQLLDQRIAGIIDDYYTACPAQKHPAKTIEMCFLVFSDSVLDVFNGICFPLYMDNQFEVDTTVEVKGAFLYKGKNVVVIDEAKVSKSNYYKLSSLDSRFADSLESVSFENRMPGNCYGPIWVYTLTNDTIFRQSIRTETR